MTIKKKREEVIEKGGHVSADLESDKKQWVNFTLRIRKDMLQDIDEALERTVGISKTGWILQSIQEKLRRSKAEDLS